MSKTPSRRSFLKVAGAAVALAACARKGTAPGTAEMQAAPAPDAYDVPSGATMPTRRLGRTGVTVSLMGLGGFHLGIPGERDAVRIVHEALDHGVTFLDNCWDYHDGESERRMGTALAGGRRDKAFLMTKLDGRSAAAASKQLDESLRRLRTDHVDLLQIHEVIRPTDPARVFGPGGAIEALVRAREAGKARFLGFTGHKSPAIHLAMLDAARRHSFRFDTVQMPLNVMDSLSGDSSFESRVLPVLLSEGIGVLGMKPMGSGVLLESGVVTAVPCLRYAMSLPVSVTITGVDSIGVLRQDLHTVLGLEPMTEHEKGALRAQAAVVSTGKFERYKTTNVFDSTAQHPQWLEGA
jgi:aryl-alcohol dehydrogenase-like predicted oxidoreductase